MAAFKRAGLHKLECPATLCDGYVYATVAQLERLGAPSCPCGAAYVPAEFELAGLLDITCAASVEYDRKCDSVARGQEGKAGHGRALGVDDSEWLTPAERAAAEIAKDRRERARARRLGAFGLREVRGKGKDWRMVQTVRVDNSPIPF